MRHETHLTLGPAPQHGAAGRIKLNIHDVSFWYGPKQALSDINLKIYENEITAFIGPSGCGKTTLLRCLNRTAELIPETRFDGLIEMDGRDIHTADLDPPVVRSRFGWIAQKPDPFPWSVRENVVYGARLKGLVTGRAEENDLTERMLTEVGLWEEVKDRLRDPGSSLSGGQKQRLCIARALAYAPEVLLMDEPCSALDPTATKLFEDLIVRLKDRTTMVIVTHNMQQAARLAQRVAFFERGRLTESGDAEDVFLSPQTPACRDYIHGLYG